MSLKDDHAPGRTASTDGTVIALPNRPRFDEPGPPAPSGKPEAAALPIYPAALTAATALVSQLASADAATLFRTIVELRRDRPDAVLHEIPLATFLAGFGPEDDEAQLQMRDADQAFHDAFGFGLVVEDQDPPESGTARFAIAAQTAAIADGAGRRADGSGPDDGAQLDAATGRWVAIVAAATRSGRGHHLALSADGVRDRAMADFACALSAADVDVLAIDASEKLAAAVLRCELHAGPRAAAVLVDRDVVDGPAATGADGWDEPEAEPELGMRHAMAVLLPALAGTRNTYVWRVPVDGSLPPALTGFVGGRIGPVRPDASWSLASVTAANPWLGPAEARRVLAVVRDPRDAGALAAVAGLAMTVPGLEAPEEACAFVAGSFGARTSPATASTAAKPVFDERLFACGADGLALLLRGGALAGGCRVLAAGGPGSGKSTYAAALADVIAQACGRAVAHVEPADFLARAWGATERLVANLWRRAKEDHLVLVADEVDSICTRREAGAPSSGNGYLIRCLTNEFLRQLDAHPDVPFLATANDAAACDPAFLRRMTALVPIDDTLSPEQELIAWESILGARPPEGWTAGGHAVADFTAALARCRLLGREDPEALAAGLTAARRARSGSQSHRPARTRRPLH